MSFRLVGTALIAALVCGFVLASAASADLDAWTAADQQGGMPAALAVAGSQAYAGIDDPFGTGGELLASSDGGASWHRSASFGSRGVLGVAIDPNPGEPVYAATRTGVLRSLDGGASWAEIAGSTGGAGQHYDAVAVDTSAPGTAYFVRDAASSGVGVFRTTTGGAGTWTDVSGGLPTNGLDGIVVDPGTHIAWGWRFGSGVYVLPSGTTWTAANAGLSADLTGLAVDRPGGRIVAVTLLGAATLPAGGGASWTTTNSGLGSTDISSVTSDAAGTVFASTFAGVYMLPSGTTTWHKVAGGLPSVEFELLAGDPTVGGHDLAAAVGGAAGTPLGGPIWRSVDGGTSFGASSTGFDAVRVQDTAISPSQPGTLVAATSLDGVERSADGGRTWSEGVTGLPTGGILSVAYDGANGNVVLSGTNTQGVFRSNDGGATWVKLTGGGAPTGASVLASDPARPGTVYSAIGFSVSKSTTDGDSWASLPSTGLPGGFNVKALAADPAAPGAVFAAGTLGLFYLPEGGAGWQPRGLTGFSLTHLAFAPGAPGTMLASTLTGGVFRSADGGATWASASSGIPEAEVDGVVFDPRIAGNAYASSASGVYHTSDGGDHWAALSGGMALPAVQKLAFDQDGDTLYGATAWLGVVARTRGRAPLQTGAPALAGSALVGSDLTGSGGTFSGLPAPAVAIGWQRCSSAGGACVAIPGAGGATYRLTDADAGATIRFAVTAQNALGSLTATSAASTIVARPISPPPAARKAPTLKKAAALKGRAKVGVTLHATVTVLGSPTPKLTWRWQRCTAKGRRCTQIKGATKASYKLRAADRRHRLRALVTAKNALASRVYRSKLTGVVR